jgi:hypothetical protein
MATTTPKNASQSMDKAKDAGAQAWDKAKEAASAAGEMASHAASAVGQKADDLTSAAGSGIRSLGESMAQHTPKEGVVGTAAQTVAGGIRETGRYLEEQGLSGMGEDLTNVIRRYPVASVLVGIGVGFLIGRTLGS